MDQRKINRTTGLVGRFVSPPAIEPNRAAGIKAAGGQIGAAEKKAEGLAG
jgi:hypothetical protein